MWGSSTADDTAEQRRRRFSRVHAGYGAATALVIAAWLAFTLHAPAGRLAGSIDDDGFYYFTIARHFAHGQGSTFNGIDSTNGYHPLWFLMLVPIFRAFSGRTAIVAVRVLESVSFGASVFLLAKIGDELRRATTMAIGASILILMGAAGPAHWFSGMESAVLIPAVLGVLLVFVRTGGLHAERLSVRACFAFGCLLALTVLARLDTVFLVISVAGFACWRLRSFGGATRVRAIVALVAPAFVTVAVYALLNEMWFGTATPISGQAKSLGGPYLNSKPLMQFLESPVFLDHSLWFGLLVLITVPAALVATRANGSDAARGLAYGAAVLLVAELLSVSYYSIASSWKLWSWYLLLSDVVLTASIAALLDASRVVARVSSAVLTRAAVVALTLAVVVVAANLYRLDRRGGRHAVNIVNSVALGAELDRELPPNAVVAMGDRAGALGFYLHRPMVQLEGLVGSAQYLDALRHGTVPEFLASHHVSIYIRSSDDPGVPAATAGCTRYMEPHQGGGPKTPIIVCARDLLVDEHLADGTYERVWRYQTNLNPET